MFRVSLPGSFSLGYYQFGSQYQCKRLPLKAHLQNEMHTFFTALHGMQTRYSDEKAVRLSVRLSNACIVTK